MALALIGRKFANPLPGGASATPSPFGASLGSETLARFRDGLTNASAPSETYSEGANSSPGNSLAAYYDAPSDALVRPNPFGGIEVIPGAGQFLNGYSQRGKINGMDQFNYDRDGALISKTKASGFSSGDSSLKEFMIGAAFALPAFGAAIAGAGAAPAAAAAPVTESAGAFLPAHEMTHAAGFLAETSPGVFAPSLAAVSTASTAAQIFTTGKSAIGLASAGASLFGGSGGATAGRPAGTASPARPAAPEIVAIAAPAAPAADSLPAPQTQSGGFISTVAESAALIPVLAVALAAYLGAR